MKVNVKNVRLSFNDLFNPKSINGGDPKFTGTFICLPETQLTFTNGKGERVTTGHEKMQQICEHVLKEKFGKVPAKADNWAYNKADGSTTRDKYVNDDGEFWAGFDEETYYISAGKRADRCKDGKMLVVDQLKQPIAASDGTLYSGCYVNVVLDVYAYDGDSGKGVTASLEGVQLKAKGDPLGMAPIDAASEFDEEEIDDPIEEVNESDVF